MLFPKQAAPFAYKWPASGAFRRRLSENSGFSGSPVDWCILIFREAKRASVLFRATVTLDRSRGKDGEDEGKQNFMRPGQPTLIDRVMAKARLHQVVKENGRVQSGEVQT